MCPQKLAPKVDFQSTQKEPQKVLRKVLRKVLQHRIQKFSPKVDFGSTPKSTPEERARSRPSPSCCFEYHGRDLRSRF